MTQKAGESIGPQLLRQVQLGGVLRQVQLGGVLRQVQLGGVPDAY